MSDCGCDHDHKEEVMEDDGGWNTVEVPDLEGGAAFRFREDEEGEIEVELSVGDPADEEKVQWYARGFIDAWDVMSEQMGADGDEEDEDGEDVELDG